MSKSLKKLIDINRLREFKNKLVGTGSPYVQTGAVDQTVAGTKTFSEPIVGSVTGSSGSCTGNAATATKATQDSDGNKITTTYSKNGHTHDDRYYTEAEVNNLLAGKANTSHIHNSVRTPNNSNTITFDWSSQVSGCVGITVDATRMGGIITTNRLVSDIRAQWYAAYPDGAEAHNAMWGGRDITAAFNNGTVSTNIANGTFRDIFPGDYITKSITVPPILTTDSPKTYTVNWVIADCDYWINKGDQNNGMETHHVVIVPQAPIFNASMNATNTTEGGYAGSWMYRETILRCATGIVNAFGSSHILTFRDLLSRDLNTSAVSSGITVFTGAPNWNSEWVPAQCNLMSEAMVYDGPHCASSALDNIMATRQMSAFRLSERLINYNRQAWWLRDVVSSAYFAHVYGYGFAGPVNASLMFGVRPFALLR